MLGGEGEGRASDLSGMQWLVIDMGVGLGRWRRSYA